jgi:2-amino-4-hydroxy-6-hydroxymethyldihydropteridine diphosphokinase
MPWTCIALGSNLGNRLKNLQQAAQSLQQYGSILHASSLFWSAPYGNEEQNGFYNAVVLFHTTNPPEKLLQILLQIEKEMGRIRQEKWGPRIIDLDIIFYENQVYESDVLRIPHPDFQNRNFVLVPLSELVPDFIPPGFSVPIQKLAETFIRDKKIRKMKKVWMK